MSGLFHLATGPDIGFVEIATVVAFSLSMGLLVVWALLFCARREAQAARARGIARQAAAQIGVDVRLAPRRAAEGDALDD